MQRKEIIAPDEFYHLYNRGTDRRVIYKTEADYKRFMSLLYLCNSTKSFVVRDLERDGNKRYEDLFSVDRDDRLVDIGAYVLMPNHYHILVKEIVDGGISKFMKKLGTGYSMYFNKKHRRTGALFEGRYKAKHINNDNYLKCLFAYIHLNPVKLLESDWKETGIKDRQKAKDYLLDYSWSSYLDYIGVDREESLIINAQSFPEYFLEKHSFKNFVHEWLTFSQEDNFT